MRVALNFFRITLGKVLSSGAGIASLLARKDSRSINPWVVSLDGVEPPSTSFAG